MYTQLVNNLDELGFTDVEPYLSEYLTTATRDGISLQEALYEISKREISLRNQRAAQIFRILKLLTNLIFISRIQSAEQKSKILQHLDLLRTRKIYCFMELRERVKHTLPQQ